MPHITLMIGSDGPVIDVAVTVGQRLQQQFVAQGVAPPQPVTIRALIDTGSDLTAIHPQILQQFGVRSSGSVRIRRPGAGSGYRLAAISEVRLSIGGISPGASWIPTRVVGVAPSTPTVLALIGRDILELCTLFYNGPRGELTLSL
jgi:predicted aspartyl protease